jgi:hypothetical protein
MDDTTPAPQVWPTLRAHDARALIRSDRRIRIVSM